GYSPRTPPGHRSAPIRARTASVSLPVMNFLFVHQFFPGQYLHLVRHLQAVGDTVIFVTQRRGREVTGIRTLEYLPLPPSAATQPYLQDVVLGVTYGLAAARVSQ